MCIALWLMSVGALAMAAKPPPNVVWVLTDDQDIELGGLTPMVKTRELLGDQGAVGEAFYVATPICCPSRTEYLSGRLYHNVLSDDLSGCMHVNSTGYIFQREAALFPSIQAKTNYMTGGFGKVINGQKNVFNPRNRPPIVTGWDWLSVPLEEGNYFTSEFFNKRPNGSHWLETLPGTVVDSWYQTAQIGNRSLDFIHAAVTAGKPFVAYLGPHAPHYSADAPPWARTLFSDLAAPRTPAYNTSVGQADKAMHVQGLPAIDGDMETWIDNHFRDRWRAIAGVDDMIGLIADELEALDILDNTFIFLTSDHGYKLGEWRIGCSKQHPYETDVHVPFLARGPGIAPGTRIPQLIANIDMAPTIIDILGLPPNPDHDGTSFLPLLQAGSRTTKTADPSNDSSDDSSVAGRLAAGWRTTQIIEYLSCGTYFNDHAKIWVSGPAATPGTVPVYGQGPFMVGQARGSNNSFCAGTEGKNPTGGGVCYFVDSTASNNWIAIRVRNASHNFVYAESYGAQAMHTAVGGGQGVFKCLDGDFCQHELYDYGPITSDYPHFPVMTEARFNLHNIYKASTAAMQATLHAELKHAYCGQRRLDIDRMDCGGDPVV